MRTPRLRGRRPAAFITLLLALLAGAVLTTPASARTLEAGEDFSCALRDDGRVFCWGAAGRLGNGTEDGSLRALQVASVSRVVDVATGAAHGCAVRAAGTVSCWGANGSGQLGDGGTDDALAPVPVDGLSDAVAVTAGEKHSCALLRDRTVRCWGSDVNGQSGGGDGMGAEDVVSFDAGLRATCAAIGDGSVSCWGIPTALVSSPEITDAAAVAVGDEHACALRRGGTVICWGANGEGQLGIGTTTAPADWQEVQGLVGATAIAAGGDETCAVRRDGTVACWGAGASGQLGDGSVAGDSVPTTVAGLIDAKGVAVGAAHACAVKADGSAVCWGDARSGRLGNDRQAWSATPVLALGTAGANVVSDGTRGHSCALIYNVAKCWGINDWGRLGDGTQEDRAIPTEVAGLGPADDIAAGYNHTCAVKTNATVRCWGEGSNGKLGNGSEDDSDVPVTVSGLTAYQVAAGYQISCAVTTLGNVSCWGARWNREAEQWVHNTTPVAIPGTDGAIKVITTDNASCALLIDGRVVCWGASDRGDIGNGLTGYPNGSTDPVGVSYASGLVIQDVSDVAAVGPYSTCAKLGNGKIVCWGDEYGPYAKEIPGSEYPQRSNRCVLGSGGVQCVGDGERGQLGDGYQPTGHFELQPHQAPVIGVANLRQPGKGGHVGSMPPADGGGTTTPPADGGGTTTPPADGGGVTPAPKPAAKSFAIGGAKAGRGRRIALTLSLPAAGRVGIAATAKVRGKRVTWFTSAKPLRFEAGTRSVSIVPTRAARKALKRAEKVKVSLRVTFTPRGGKAVVETTTATVRRAGGGA
jgi:alpha-tubulin suppressor-like RCC1 family protein